MKISSNTYNNIIKGFKELSRSALSESLVPLFKEHVPLELTLCTEHKHYEYMNQFAYNILYCLDIDNHKKTFQEKVRQTVNLFEHSGIKYPEFLPVD